MTGVKSERNECMSSPRGQITQIACPSCQSPLQVQIVNIIDADAQPQLKSLLLGGRLNTGVCPSCGTPVALAAPLVYHDAGKQFCFVHIPQQLLASANANEIEKFVGSVTNMLMNALPPEAPKAYLLAPKRFLTMQSLIEAVFEGDGVTKEMLANQRKRVDLISAMLDAMQNGDAALYEVVQKNTAEMDDEFTTTLNAFIEASQMSGDPQGIALLSQLQSKLAQFAGGEATFAYEQMIDQLLNAADDEARKAIVIANQDIVDYTFFDIIKTRLDNAQSTGDTTLVAELTHIQDFVVTVYQQLQADLEQAFVKAGETLDAVFSAEDLQAALQAHVADLDDVFVNLVAGQIAMAERAGDAATVARLMTIAELTPQVKESALSPEDRVVNALLNAENATRYIRENISDITGAVVKRLNEVAEEYTTKGKTEEAERTRRIAREAGAMLF